MISYTSIEIWLFHYFFGRVGGKGALYEIISISSFNYVEVEVEDELGGDIACFQECHHLIEPTVSSLNQKLKRPQIIKLL